MMKKKALMAVIYARTGSGDNNPLTIDEQIDAAMEFADSRNDVCVVDIIADEGFDGIALQRPGFMQIMEKMVAGEVDCIIVDDICRISSNAIELAYLMVDILPELDVEMFFGETTVDCDDPDNAFDCLMSVVETYSSARGVDEVHIDDVDMHFVR